MIKSDILIESKSLRESVIDKTYVLDKVKKLIMLPDDIHMTVEMLATYYEVTPDAIRQLAVRKKDELESDGMKTLRGKELSDIKSLCGLSRNIGRLMLFTRRSALRVGMLLEESEVAKVVRDVLLDNVAPNGNEASTNVVQIPTELNILGQLSDAISQSYKAMLQIQSQIAEADKKADEANKMAAEANEKNKELIAELDDIKKGMVNVDVPLRTQFNDAVRKYARRHSLEWEDAYNNIYSVLAKQNHVDLKKRLQNKIERGEKAKMVDVVEELNLLVPAIRLAKTMAGVAI
ncbi:hypothetical protein [Gorillibacterium sp. sgz5001074]|uniref:hypothetical protein n=1 Tax=Gorillibacterium sp. sgz5001074 TaxID=3446695 RepID=UPI003F67CD59